MTESLTRASEKTGLPPGSLIHVGDVSEFKTTAFLIDYNQDHIEEQHVFSMDHLLSYKDSDSVTWLIIEGLASVDIVEKIGGIFKIHPLVLEDILNTHQRPKLEDYDDYLFIVLKTLVANDKDFSVTYEQVSLLLLNNFVITFKEHKDTVLDPVKLRLKSKTKRFRSLGADYLTYAILDTLIDKNFDLVDALDDAINGLEDEVLSCSTQETLNKIQQFKREIIHIRKNLSPIRDLLAKLSHSESDLIHDNTVLYFRDVSDHAVRIIESIETYREILSGLLEIYISNMSNKMNEVMKVLTVFASIFIPLTFLAGIYGMNFEYMPELKWKWAYPTLWVAFITIPVVLLIYFRKKKWL